ncbi:MAG TPA: hypothetical protein VGY13_07790 [Solirubrobacteraceae bacterium]|jgi:type II secretory pathway component PulJ|nr:hypothetical protein [Solirubrobacteraceae bacterium]
MLKLPQTESILHSEGGFTLMETLVAMVAGVVLTGALAMIFIVAVHQTSRLTDSVQSTQLGRTAMTHITDELRSACLKREFTPVQENSGPNELIFFNAYGEEALIPNAKQSTVTGAGAFEHQIIYNSTTHTLTDFVYPSESGSEWPNFKYPALDYNSSTREAANAEPKKGVQLATNVSEAKVGSVFQYYKYGTAVTSSSTAPETTLQASTLTSGKLTSKEAANVASVLVSFTAAPLDGNTKASRAAEFSSQVTFAFSTPSSEATISDKPCE